MSPATRRDTVDATVSGEVDCIGKLLRGPTCCHESCNLGDVRDIGDACAESDDCCSDVCLVPWTGDNEAYCTQPCTPPAECGDTVDCPSGFACEEAGEEHVCVRFASRGELGWPCASGEDCASGLCVEPRMGEPACSVECDRDDDASCPGRFRCGDADRDVCVYVRRRSGNVRSRGRPAHVAASLVLVSRPRSSPGRAPFPVMTPCFCHTPRDASLESLRFLMASVARPKVPCPVLCCLSVVACSQQDHPLTRVVEGDIRRRPRPRVARVIARPAATAVAVAASASFSTTKAPEPIVAAIATTRATTSRRSRARRRREPRVH